MKRKRQQGGASNERSKVESNMILVPPLLSPCTVPTKKLLILDLNGVLLKKADKNSKRISLRPHVHSFLQHMSELFYLAVWTSGRADTMHKAMLSLFQTDRYKEKLVFYWTQNECTYIPANVTSAELSELICPPKKTKRKRKLNATDKPMGSNAVSKDARALDQKWTELGGSFKKILAHVFARYPSFCCETTLLVDDSPDKHSLNPPQTVVCPRSFAPPKHDSSGAVEEKTDSSALLPPPLSASSALSPLSTLRHSAEAAPDEELKEGGGLWSHLVSMAAGKNSSSGHSNAS